MLGDDVEVSIAAADDTVLSSPQGNQVLSYNAGTAKWVNKNVATSDLSGTLTHSQLVPGTPIYVFYNGTNWTDAAGTTISTRPTSRTDIPIVLVDTTTEGTASIPGWALQRDFVLQSPGGSAGSSGTAILQWYGESVANGHIIAAGDAGTGDLAVSSTEGSAAPTISTGATVTPAVSFAQAAGQICVINWTNAGTHTTGRARIFLQTPSSWYSSTQSLARFSNADGTTQYLGVSLRGSAVPGSLSLNDTTNNNVLTTPNNTLSLSTWYRVEFAIDQNAGTAYLGIWDMSNHQIYDSGATALSVGSGGWGRFRWGPMVSGVTTSLLMAKLKVIEETNVVIGAN